MSATKTRKAINEARVILMHPAVSHVVQQIVPATDAMDQLRRARIAVVNDKAAKRNGTRRHGDCLLSNLSRRFAEAIAAGGLPSDLDLRCRAWVARATASEQPTE